MNYAGFWIRLGAYLIDFIILLIISYIIQAITGIDMGMDFSAAFNDAMVADGTSQSSLLGNVIGIVIGIAYFAGFESSKLQATIGKKAVGLVVVDKNGGRISFLRAIARYFAKIISAVILLIGFIMVAFTDKKQGLHDFICGTFVVKGQPGQHSAAGVFE